MGEGSGFLFPIFLSLVFLSVSPVVLVPPQQ